MAWFGQQQQRPQQAFDPFAPPQANSFSPAPQSSFGSPYGGPRQNSPQNMQSFGGARPQAQSSQAFDPFSAPAPKQPSANLSFDPFAAPQPKQSASFDPFAQPQRVVSNANEFDPFVQASSGPRVVSRVANDFDPFASPRVNISLVYSLFMLVFIYKYKYIYRFLPCCFLFI